MLQHITSRPHIQNKLNAAETVELAGGQKIFELTDKGE
jgi:hypothetical protein